jgi:hypothetical protein
VIAHSGRRIPWSPRLLLGTLAVLVACLCPAGAPSAEASSIVLAPGRVVEAAPLSSGATTPADGRLRGPEFSGVVSRVAWPQSVPSPSGITYVADRGRRLVAFTVAITQATDDSGLLNEPTGVTGTLRVGKAALGISMVRVDQAIAGGSSGSTETTGTESFVASVPASSHEVSLGLTESGFTQWLDLWTLQRVPPSPVVLYRDAQSSSVTGTGSASFHLAFSNPADGYGSTDSVQVSSASLSWFAPGGTHPADPNDADLVVGLQSSYPSVPYGQPNSGHFFSGFTPLPGSRLIFTPTGGAGETATADTADFSSTNAASDDDGLFDAIYTFTVPATTTGGSLAITPGPAEGTEYTGFTGSGTSTSIDITQPASVLLSYPAVPARQPAQRTPPWVGAPLPATGLAAIPPPASGTGSSGGFPIWLAVLVLVLVALGIVLIQRRRRAPTTATSTAGVSGTDSVSPEAVDGFGPLVPEPVVAPGTVEATDAPPADVAVNVLGPVEFVGLRQESDRRIVYELLAYLACHAHRHLRVGQIQIGLRPLGSSRPEIGEKTLRNYLSELRACIGVEHLPEASGRDGYLLEGVATDWERFQGLTREADALGGAAASRRRAEALALVRGRPFEDVVDLYEWVSEEHLETQMGGAIAACAHREATDRFEAGDADGAEKAVRQGLRGSPADYSLWQIGARAVRARQGRSALKRWLADAAIHLEPEDVARIEASLDGLHDVGQS